MKLKLTITAVLLVVAASSVYSYLRRGPKLAENDRILLADFRNTTGESVFDGSLREALGISLAQSPYLDLLSSEKVSDALRAMGHGPDEPLMGGVARKVCEGTRAKALITGEIAKEEGVYQVSLNTIDCTTGASIAETQGRAINSRQVLHALGTAATELRAKFGEDPGSIQRFNIPLERAISPSLEAVKLYSEGRRLTRQKGALEGVAPLKSAIDIDARFAMAYSSLAVNHYNLNQNALASDEIRQAFEMADRQTFRERLQITTLYYDLGTGDVQKAIASYKQWTQLYPRDDVPRGDLSSEYFLTGEYEQAALNAKEALSIEPSSLAWYENLSTADIALFRLDEAHSVLDEAFARKLDDSSLHANVYALAFLRNDSGAMEKEVASQAGKDGGEDIMLALQADTQASAGHLKKARDFSRRAVESAQKSQLAEPAAIWQSLAALRETAFGNKAEARKWSEEILKIAPNSRDAQVLTGLILARAEETQRARAILDDLRARYVANTMVQAIWVPMIQAQLEMVNGNPGGALEALQATVPYERGQPIGNLSNCCMLPIYLRGEAYLSAGQGPQAAAEFQRILDSRGIVVNCWAGSLARLGRARGLALSGYTAGARTAYEQFFSHWKDADADIPILKAARVEYARLK